jgi:hypothetical protein
MWLLDGRASRESHIDMERRDRMIRLWGEQRYGGGSTIILIRRVVIVCTLHAYHKNSDCQCTPWWMMRLINIYDTFLVLHLNTILLTSSHNVTCFDFHHYQSACQVHPTLVNLNIAGMSNGAEAGKEVSAYGYSPSEDNYYVTWIAISPIEKDSVAENGESSYLYSRYASRARKMVLQILVDWDNRNRLMANP